MFSPRKTLADKLMVTLSIKRFLGTAETTTISKKKLNDGALKKWAIVSPLVNAKQLASQLVTGVEVTPLSTTWAVIDTHLNEVIDCGTYPLFSEDVKVSSSVVLDLAHRVKEVMPRSDLYVLEDKTWTKSGGFKSHNDIGINLLSFQAMLYSLLNDNFIPDQSLHKVFYIQPRAILKLFKLKVGNERVSSQHIVQKMIRRSEFGYVLDNSWENVGSLQVATEHYGQLCWTNPDVIKMVWTRDELWRENVSNAILAAHAFTDLCLKEDGNALRLLWNRSS